MMTDQEVFDKVARHLLAQGCRAVKAGLDGDADSCVYRARDGKKCAAGALIDDAFYSGVLEGSTVEDVDVGLALFHSGVDINNVNTRRLLIRLQDMHDEIEADEWRDHLIFIAFDFGLEAAQL